jgi:glycosyltransferase involved in cell wall biosynthesis/peptidoglycan/xylan/chitin deacetylase (PgdA/CDA1 family)
VELFPIGIGLGLLRAKTLPERARRLKDAAAEFTPNVVHAQSVMSAVMARLALPDVPLLVTIHGISKSNEPLAALLLRAAGVHLTAVSEAAAEGLRRHRWAPPVEILPPGIDVDRLRADASAAHVEPFGEPSIVCVARHHPVKGIDVLLRALPGVLEAFPDAGLTLVGTGPELQGNIALAAELGIEEHCRFPGLIPVAAPYIASADVVVLPSRREGLPVVALEALALERPLVATDVGGTSTVAVDGETAWLVPPEDPQALAAAIVECLEQPEEAARRARAGHELVAERFDTRPMLDLVERLLRELVHERQSVPPLKSYTYHRLVRLNQRQRIAWKMRRRAATDWQGVRIFGYHRVASLDDVTAVSPDAFTAQMEHLVDSDVEVVQLEAALRLLEEPVDGRYACVTFDDGYLDTLDTALPVLERLRIPATVFVVVDVLEGRATFDWNPAPPPAIRVDDLPRLLASGLVDVQAHSVTHRRLTMLSDEELREEVAGSRMRLAKHVPTPTSFCYPAGIYGPREVEAVYAAGFRAGVTTRPGVNVGGFPLGDLRRTMLYWGDDLEAFAAKLDGALDESTAAARFLAARRSHARSSATSARARRHR